MIVTLTAGATWWWAEWLDRTKTPEGFVYEMNSPILSLIALAVIGPFVLPYAAYVPLFLTGSVLLGFLLDAIPWPVLQSRKRQAIPVVLMLAYYGGGGVILARMASKGAGGLQLAAIGGLILSGGLCAAWASGSPTIEGAWRSRSGGARSSGTRRSWSDSPSSSSSW